jgi:hypothetical protein
MQTTTDWSKGLDIEVRGDDVVAHTGTVITRMLADRTGLTGELSDALARPDVIHDRGRVLADLSLAIADGATSISDIGVLGDQQRILGPVASTSTTWRTLNEIDVQAIKRITAARNRTRTKVWSLIEARHGSVPPIATCYGDIDAVIGIRIDATLVNSYSDKQQAAGNFKGGYGFHPLTAWCDNTGECLAIIARPGNAGSNTAADHIEIIDAAIAALPAKHRRNLLITIDGAGSSHKVIEHLTELNARSGFTVEYSVGFDLDKHVRGAIAALPEQAWEPALDHTGAPRRDAQVAEVTGLLRDSVGGDKLGSWPAGMRILIRREPIEDATQLSLFEQLAGYRYQPIATNTASGQLQRLEARHRAHARVEGFIRYAKATGLATWPSSAWSINTAWVAAVAIACDLLCWTRLLLLDGALAIAEPATLRYRLLHAGARIIKRSRKTILRISETWPWATELQTAFHRVAAIP